MKELHPCALTIDLEDWYQGIALPSEYWHLFEKRLFIGLERILTLLSRRKLKATFFLLGKAIEEHPDLIWQILKEGHEIGCHTYAHLELYKMSPLSFEADLQQCQDLIAPFGATYTGFRAPYFSLEQRSWWAIGLLKKHFDYDSSIYPGDNKRTGIKGYRKDLHFLCDSLVEAPVSTFSFLHYDLGLGGAYFRILPFSVFWHHMQKCLRQAPGVFYLHPWEMDPQQPYLNRLASRIRFPHYFNLESTEKRLALLLDQVEFVPLNQVVSSFRSAQTEQTFCLNDQSEVRIPLPKYNPALSYPFLME